MKLQATPAVAYIELLDMKFPIEWHQECLKNRKAHYARERQYAMEALARCDKGDAENEFYARQIAEAQRRRKTAFDRDRLLVSNAEVSGRDRNQTKL